MFEIYATTALLCVASLIAGRGILALLGSPRPPWLSAATGFAALVIVCPLLLRLPGRSTTAVVVLGVVLAVAAWVALRDLRRVRDTDLWPLAAAVAAIAVAVASLPFAISDGVGVLGQGVYTNDHAAQLYWADWLAHGFGPEPSAVRFGYPVGPQAVAVVAATVTGTDLVSAFNGLLLAIPALTGLTALGALVGMPPGRRIAIASISALPYLAASFLAQSAFKETAMAMFVLAFAIVLASRSGERGSEAIPGLAEVPPWRTVIAIGLLLAGAAVFTFSIPGLVWFAVALALWLALEGMAGRGPVEWAAVRDGVRAHRRALAVGAIAAIAVGVLAFSPAREFASKIADVQESAGRLSSPVFWGEAFGIWPAGDFRVVRGEVAGALPALALGALALLFGVLVLLRDRALSLLAVLAAGGAVYVGARLFAEIHVEAKALAVISPLVVLVGLRALLSPSARGTGGAGRPEPRQMSVLRYVAGIAVALAMTTSTLLALRDAPIGPDGRQSGLERLAARADGETIAFLGVDRFAGYYLRGTLARAPAGYVPQEIAARPEKTWQQGLAADFDSLDSGQLDRFRYAITTTAAHGSSAPPNFEPVLEAGDYVLWERRGETPRARVLEDEGGDPGAILRCAGGPPERRGEATVLTEPAVAPHTAWRTPAGPEQRVAGQERGWQAPGEASIELELPASGRFALSLQYHSQVRLSVFFDGDPVAELPPSLDGMYLSGAGRGAFWPAGEIESDRGAHEVTVRASEPRGLAADLGARRLVWLGDLAASRLVEPRTVSLARACGSYVDRFAYARPGRGR